MTTTDDYDSPWKDALETYLEEFLLFFFPQAHAEIDWTRGYVFLDKELQQVVRDADLGRRLADKLVQVWRTDGSETWVLIHIEIQSQADPDFAQRMFVYYYRIFDRYRRQVVSLAVLADERTSWRPDQYHAALWGCAVQFTFPVVKLLDYQDNWPALEASRNPFATVVMAHLTAQETRQDAPERARAKLHLTRRLYELGYSRTDIINLFHFIDWLLRLPEELEQQFWQEIEAWEEAQKMPYISSVEQRGIQKGRREELLAGIALALDLKFGNDGLALLPEIQLITEVALLQAIRDRIKAAGTPDDLRRVYAGTGDASIES
ncbi:MAG: cytosolic protein [Chloroflexaceae bacterium]